MWYVYQLINKEGQVIYIGETRDPRQRLYDHTRRKPKHSGHGKFYGQDLEIEVIAEFDNKKDAWNRQVEEQKKFGFQTDYDKLRAGVTLQSCRKGGQTTAIRRRMLTSK